MCLGESETVLRHSLLLCGELILLLLLFEVRCILISLDCFLVKLTEEEEVTNARVRMSKLSSHRLIT